MVAGGVTWVIAGTILRKVLILVSGVGVVTAGPMVEMREGAGHVTEGPVVEMREPR